MSLFDRRNPIRPVQSGRGHSGFALGRYNRKLFGVCSGIADYVGLDVTLVRIAWVLGTIFGFGSLILVYLAIAMIAD